MNMPDLVEKIKNAGVIGAGGAGFPTHVKYKAQAHWLLANGAECEPLMHKDRELMLNFAPEIVEGIALAAGPIAAKELWIGIKSKNSKAIQAIRDAAKDIDLKIREFNDFYPAGDEYELVYEITGKLVPAGGIPLQVDSIVNNVETFYNIYHAHHNRPVINTFLTITGQVKDPVTLFLPIGTSVRQALEVAGGTLIDDFAVMNSGILMGKLIKDLDQPIGKTTGGLIVLPREHRLIQRYSMTKSQMNKIGHSACDQCSYCTELCPRYLLGYDIQPHKVMRSLGFTMASKEMWNRYAQLCCQCGICTLYACPEDLYPREACVQSINNLKEIGVTKWEGPTEVKAHPMKNERRVPMKLLNNKLGLTPYEAEAQYKEIAYEPPYVRVLIDQHIGIPARPVVKEKQIVDKGQLIAEPVPDAPLSAAYHASISGRVTRIDPESITIERI
jgi:Na+-translocating ferredoxin:NAD+ oxidoreductase RnfC subunit